MIMDSIYAPLAQSLGISVLATTIFIGIIAIWDLVWRCIGVYRSTKNNQPIWSIAFVLFQTIGILPIVYLLFFQRKTQKQIKLISSKRTLSKKSDSKKRK
jgi:hypothetical protein